METLYYGKNIITMTGEGERVEAVLVKDGRIAFTGDYAEAKALAGADCVELDLGDKTLMPSFIDGHSHITMYSQFSMFPDISGASSFEEIKEFIRGYLKQHPPKKGDVVMFTGYDHNFLKEEQHPTRDILDEVSEDTPVYLYHSSGHMGVINTAMMKLAGLDENASDPQGGHYGRYEDGRLNGYLEEPAAFAPVMMKAFANFKMNPVKQLNDVQDIYLKNGITTVQDGGNTRETIEGLIKFAMGVGFKLDVVAYQMYEDSFCDLQKDYPQFTGSYTNRLKIAGTKIFLDGSPQGKSAWLSKPYEGEASYCGYPTQKNETVVGEAIKAIQGGYQLLAHCNGDAASQQFIDCYKEGMEKCESDGADLRPVMIHCQTAREDQLEEMKKIGMLPSIFVAHTYYWGDVHLKNLGEERGNRISPVQTANKIGLKYNFHQDCPVLPPDMLKTIWCAVNRKTRKGVSIGEEERISVYDALKGVTINAAYAYHEENEKGTLEKGKLADMVILDTNPLCCAPCDIDKINVLETIKEGETLYSLHNAKNF